MPWKRLSERLESLPLVLCGPLLRRVDNTSTTVWIALRKPQKVTLRVYKASNLASSGVRVQIGTRSTVKLGQHLHVVAVTAFGSLGWGELYLYDLRFGTHGSDTVPVPENERGLFTENILAGTGEDARKRILYDVNELGPGMAALDLPSFATPPTDLNKVRLVHGSCRKPHGESKDALQILDNMIRGSLSDPLRRPHQLFLTGDQIYADDVADGLLAMLTDAGDTLLGWIEQLPLPDGNKKPSDLLPGHRQETIENSFFHPERPFTTGEGRSHLFSVGEFYSMYLFVWSEACWPSDLPSYSDVHDHDINSDKPTIKSYVAYEQQSRQLKKFLNALPRVRRALANIPSFMMFDDHEITDDWYLDRKWCKVALKSPLGKRVISNGLLAYAIFQGWGNTPERYNGQGAVGEPGIKLLEAASKWDGAGDHEALKEIQQRVGLNQSEEVENNKKLTHPTGTIDWHYHLPATTGGPAYEVIVLDTRTYRGYPGGPKDPAALISDKTVLDLQLAQGIVPPIDGLTIVIAPAPVIGDKFVEEFVQEVLPRYFADREGWLHHPETFQTLLSELAQRNSRIVLLSGDVHYGFSAHVSYWAQRPFGTPKSSTQSTHYQASMAQLTASSFKNETSDNMGTYFQHKKGWGPLKKTVQIAGWHDPPRVTERILQEDNKEKTAYSILGSHPPLLDLNDYNLRRGNIGWTVDAQPDWSYRIDYLISEERNATPATIPLPSNWKAEGMETYLAGSAEYKKFMAEYAPGREIVGFNNIGEITFEWNAENDRSVIHQLWWWLAATAQPFPLSKYIVSLRLNDPKYPEPLIPPLS